MDVFHIYKGGSDFASLRLFNGATLHVLHINDYPAQPPRATVTDAHRVYPGDGVAPLGLILRTLAANGFRGHLSLELFNAGYLVPTRPGGRPDRPGEDPGRGAQRLG